MGVSRALSTISLESAIVIDIGGGSTEIISGNLRAQPVDISLPLGAVYLTERFILNDPPTEEELELLREFVRAELRNVSFDIDARNRGSVLAGTAGTITTLAAMDQKLPEYLPEKINGSVLTLGSIEQHDRKAQRNRSETSAERFPGLSRAVKISSSQAQLSPRRS